MKKNKTKTFEHSNRLILDLGMNNGDDSYYYIRKGFQVISVEANINLCKAAEKRFKKEIIENKITIVHSALSSQDGNTFFYINTTNDKISSINKAWAERENAETIKVSVPTTTLKNLFEKFGTPSYLKIDIEGADSLALAQLEKSEKIPAFVSIEDCRHGFEYIDKMYALGYREFKLVDQSTISTLEDTSIGYKFPEGSSGPIPAETSGKWNTYEEMIKEYSETVRTRDGTRLGPRTKWWDIHGRAK